MLPLALMPPQLDIQCVTGKFNVTSANQQLHVHAQDTLR